MSYLRVHSISVFSFPFHRVTTYAPRSDLAGPRAKPGRRKLRAQDQLVGKAHAALRARGFGGVIVLLGPGGVRGAGRGVRHRRGSR